MHQILLPVATRMCFAGMAPFHPDDGIFLSGTALFLRTTAFFIRNEFIRTMALFHPDEKIFSSGTALFIRTMALFHPERHFFIRTTALFLRTTAFFIRTIPLTANLQPLPPRVLQSMDSSQSNSDIIGVITRLSSLLVDHNIVASSLDGRTSSHSETVELLDAFLLQNGELYAFSATEEEFSAHSELLDIIFLKKIAKKYVIPSIRRFLLPMHLRVVCRNSLDDENVANILRLLSVLRILIRDSKLLVRCHSQFCRDVH